MRPFPHLHIEQDHLLEWLPDAMEPGGAATSAIQEICRAVTAISEVRIEIVYPRCVGHARPDLIDASMIDFDLMRVLVYELENTQPTAFLFPALIAALARLLRHRLAQEEASDGLWASALAGGLAPESVDIDVGARLEQLSRQSSWLPLQPLCLETLRSSVPPGAIRYEP